jgi:hypothetical protein
MHPRCSHTGLPTYCCGHCNGSKGLEKEPFKGRGVSDEPRLVKGRDKCQWEGRGRHLNPELPSRELHKLSLDTLPKGSCVRPMGFSSWGRKSLGLE